MEIVLNSLIPLFEVQCGVQTRRPPGWPFDCEIWVFVSNILIVVEFDLNFSERPLRFLRTKLRMLIVVLIASQEYLWKSKRTPLLLRQ